ncbi:MAG: hypothetical protein M1821_002998 [Bathelium mastoideum]|nr:MAG: hypothetical protein M1821_002998 [Bathelium mastoideum]
MASRSSSTLTEYGSDQSRGRHRQHPQTQRTPNSPPYQEPPKLPPLSTVLEEVARPSSPPTTPGGQSSAASPVKRGSQDYGLVEFSDLTHKRLKIDSLVDDTPAAKSPEHSWASDRRPPSRSHHGASPRPKLPSFEQSFSPLYPSHDDRPSSSSRSHRSSYSYDPFYNAPPANKDILNSTSMRRVQSRSPPRIDSYQGHQNHQRPSIGPGWTYPNSSVPAQARPPPASPSPYYASHAPETRPTTYYGPQYNGYSEGYPGPQYPGQVRNAAAPAPTYGESPYQYSWAAMPGAAECHGQRRRRGNLPREATNMMKKWFQEHLKSPYPSEEEKMQFCEMTGLSMNQVGNWFINARRRHPEMRDNRGSVSNQNSQESQENG